MSEKLTGRKRYSLVTTSGFLGFGKREHLVLEVEVTTTDGPSDSWGMPTSLGGTYWRYARVSDLVFVDSDREPAHVE